MSRNSNQGSLGCGFIIILVIVIIYHSIDVIFFEPQRDAEVAQSLNEEQQKLEKLWTKPTVDFFKKFNSSNLKFEEQEFKTTKFIAVDTYSHNECYIDLYTDISYDNYKIFDSIYTRKINEVNTIVWIIQKRGKVEGTYTGGEKAIRLLSEINFIDKSTNTIFKKINVDYLGVAPEKITRSNYSHQDEVFGERDHKGEYIAIVNEIKRQHGIPPLN